MQAWLLVMCGCQLPAVHPSNSPNACNVTNLDSPATTNENLSLQAQAGAQLPSAAALAASRYALASPPFTHEAVALLLLIKDAD